MKKIYVKSDDGFRKMDAEEIDPEMFDCYECLTRENCEYRYRTSDCYVERMAEND